VRPLRVEALSVLRGLRHLIPGRERSFRALALGLPRSGTHSLAYAFAGGYRSRHEPLAAETITHLLRWQRGGHTDDAMRGILLFRDRILQLDLEASFFMYHFAALLPDLFPEMRFVLTVREPRSWAESLMNQTFYALRGGQYRFWEALTQFRHARWNLPYEYESIRAHADSHVYPLRSYLRYWVNHLTTVVRHVPASRLLVVDTFDLRQRMPDVVAFAGAKVRRLNLQRVRSAQQHAKRLQLDDLVPPEAVTELVREECLETVETHFPFLRRHMTYLDDGSRA
jgi:hypothetical protein